MTQKFVYIGVLGNVDESIRNVTLPNGFHIDSMPFVEMLKIGSELTGEPMKSLENQWTSSYRCIIDSQLRGLGQDEKKTTFDLVCFYITKSYEVDIEISEDNRIATVEDWMKLTEPANEATMLVPDLLRKINLFKDGHVCAPVSFEFIVDGEKMTMFSAGRSNHILSRELLSLESGESKELQEFIDVTRLPDRNSYIGLALENYELSYRAENPGLSFITAFIALEVLFDAGAHKVARNMAVLLGSDADDSKRIFNEVKELHNKRSNLVHSGKMNKISDEDLIALRRYTRKAIVRTNTLDMQKAQLIEKLNMLGFGACDDM